MRNRTLQRRLARLEAGVGIGVVPAPPPPNLILVFTDKTSEPVSAERAECRGREWCRSQDETQSEFKHRVAADVRMAGHRSPSLICMFEKR